MPTYLGIDLAASPRRPSGFAALDDHLSLQAIGQATTDEDLLALASLWQPRYIAVDAPLSLPAGMCCLEETCPCRPLAPDGLKAAERKIIRRGIGLFVTGKRSTIKAMVYRAMSLKAALEGAGYTVLEVYPYACKVALFGRPIPKKTTAAGRRWLQERIGILIPGLKYCDRPLSHDQLDALIAAYTAYQHAHERVEAFGDAGEGLIYLSLPPPTGHSSTLPTRNVSLLACFSNINIDKLLLSIECTNDCYDHVTKNSHLTVCN